MKKMNENNIGAYLHCGKCLSECKNKEEIRTVQSPKEYSKVSVGWTKKGMQVWCDRHNCNIVNIDFQGQKHPADITRRKK